MEKIIEIFGLDTNESLPFWRKRINAGFWKLLLNNIQNCKPTLIFDFSLFQEENDITGLGFTPKECVKNTLIFDVFDSERILGIFDKYFNDNSDIEYFRIFFKHFLGDSFNKVIFKDFLFILYTLKDNEEGTSILTLINLIYDDDFWRYRISKNGLSSNNNDKELDNLRNKLKKYFLENNVWINMLGTSLLPNILIPIEKSINTIFSKTVFVPIQPTNLDNREISLIVDLLLYINLKNNKNVTIFAIFDDSNFIENSFVYSLFNSQLKTKIYIQKSDIIDINAPTLNVDYMPYKRISEICIKYSRMKYNRRREFVNAEILASLGIDLDLEKTKQKK